LLLPIAATGNAQWQWQWQWQSRQQAQAERDATVCGQRTGSASLETITCTRAIKLGQHSPLTLATLHNSLGTA
jgi:hypothetical protein